MNLDEAIGIFAHDGIFHLAAADRNDNIAKIIAEPFNPEIHYPIIYLHIHYAMLKEAKELLEAIPDKKDETYNQLNDFYQALVECDNWNTAVFPLNISYRKWWDGPHLSFPEGYISWNPLKVEVIVEEDDTQFSAVVGENESGKISYGCVELPIKNCVIRPELDMFGEIAFYSDDKDDYIIDFHREKQWIQPPELASVKSKIQPYITKSHDILIEKLAEDMEKSSVRNS